jgi:lipoyl-dependent peroxiredoxin subunit D
MNFELLRDSLPDFAKDTRLNLDSVLSESGAPGLSAQQIAGIALTSAATCKSMALFAALQEKFSADTALTDAALGASSLMAMNNVYYRAIHLAEDSDLGKMPAKLRMNLLAKPPVPKADFELYSLAASSINGCGACIASHVKQAKHAGLSQEGIQSTLRIAAVIAATSHALACMAPS